MSILLVGDLHLDSQSPISRIDNYRETTLNKLMGLYTLAVSNSASAVITAGDFFDKYYVPISYLNEVMDILKKFKDSGITFYSLIGNHDLPHDNMKFFSTTPLSLLYKSELVHPLHPDKTTIVENTAVFGINFTEIDRVQEVSELANSQRQLNKLLIMHYATDRTIPDESVERTQLSAFDFVLSGHDHTPYGLDGENPVMLRPGSLMRRTKDDYNIIRDSIIVYKLDGSNVTELSLPNVQKADIIFSAAAILGVNVTILNSLRARFTGDFFKAESQSIYSILEDLKKTQDVKLVTRIEKELRKMGIQISKEDTNESTRALQ